MSVGDGGDGVNVLGWNSLTQCTSALLKRHGALVTMWSAHKFSFNAAQPGQSAAEFDQALYV